MFIDHTGKAKTKGTFKGLKENAKVKVGRTEYRISYRGGDGNDVVLTAISATTPALEGTPGDDAFTIIRDGSGNVDVADLRTRIGLSTVALPPCASASSRKWSATGTRRFWRSLWTPTRAGEGATLAKREVFGRP